MNREKIADLLQRYTNGQTNPQETEQVERWLEETGNPDPDWKKLDNNSKDIRLSQLFRRIQGSIREEPRVVPIRKQQPVKWRSIAAVAAVLVICSTLYLLRPTIKSRFAVNRLTVLRTAVQKKQYALADGSRVWVNSGSVLQFPEQFNGDKREVWLSGEAYFDVHHDPKRPFLIHTGNVLTTVLGTAFNVREDKRLHIITVTVTRGKVSVAGNGKLLGILTPNQQLAFNTVSNQATVQSTDAEQAIAWRQSDLHFDDISFGDAARQLEQHYHIKISFSNEQLRNCRFTATFLEGESLDRVLKVICSFNNAGYKKGADGQIIIGGKGCEQNTNE